MVDTCAFKYMCMNVPMFAFVCSCVCKIMNVFVLVYECVWLCCVCSQALTLFFHSFRPHERRWCIHCYPSQSRQREWGRHSKADHAVSAPGASFTLTCTGDPQACVVIFHTHTQSQQFLRIRKFQSPTLIDTTSHQIFSYIKLNTQTCPFMKKQLQPSFHFLPTPPPPVLDDTRFQHLSSIVSVWTVCYRIVVKSNFITLHTVARNTISYNKFL